MGARIYNSRQMDVKIFAGLISRMATPPGSLAQIIDQSRKTDTNRGCRFGNQAQLGHTGNSVDFQAKIIVAIKPEIHPGHSSTANKLENAQGIGGNLFVQWRMNRGGDQIIAGTGSILVLIIIKGIPFLSNL